jgi:hypothetical protein
LRQLGKKPRTKLLQAPLKALFRVFFHPHGGCLLLLLGGYDKAKRSNELVPKRPDQVGSQKVGGLAEEETKAAHKDQTARLNVPCIKPIITSACPARGISS